MLCLRHHSATKSIETIQHMGWESGSNLGTFSGPTNLPLTKCSKKYHTNIDTWQRSLHLLLRAAVYIFDLLMLKSHKTESSKRREPGDAYPSNPDMSFLVYLQ